MKKIEIYRPILREDNQKIIKLKEEYPRYYELFKTFYNSESYLKFPNRYDYINHLLYVHKFQNAKYKNYYEYLADGNINNNEGFKYSKKSKSQKTTAKLSYVTLNAIILKENLGKYYREFLYNENEFEIIDIDEHYNNDPKKGKVKSKGYRLNYLLHTLDWEKVEVTDEFLIEKLNKHKLEKSLNDNYYINQYINNIIPRFRLKNVDEIRNKINNLKQEDIEIGKNLDYVKAYDNWSVDSFLSNDIFHKLDKKSGRFFWNLTSFPRWIRENNITNDKGSIFIEIDVANSQPWFLPTLMKKSGYEVDKKYLELIKETKENNGIVLYDYITNKYFQREIETIGYSAAKDYVKKHILEYQYSTNDQNEHGTNRIPTIYMAEFPFVYKFIETFKIKAGVKTGIPGNEALAIILQGSESNIFIRGVSRKLTTEDILHATIHDSIMCELENGVYVYNLVEKTFKDVNGDVPTLRIKLNGKRISLNMLKQMSKLETLNECNNLEITASKIICSNLDKIFGLKKELDVKETASAVASSACTLQSLISVQDSDKNTVNNINKAWDLKEEKKEERENKILTESTYVALKFGCVIIDMLYSIFSDSSKIYINRAGP